MRKPCLIHGNAERKAKNEMFQGLFKEKGDRKKLNSAVAAAFLMLSQTERLEQLELLERQYLAEDSEPRLAR